MFSQIAAIGISGFWSSGIWDLRSGLKNPVSGFSSTGFFIHRMCIFGTTKCPHFRRLDGNIRGFGRWSIKDFPSGDLAFGVIPKTGFGEFGI